MDPQGKRIRVAIKTLRNEHSETNKENFRREAQVMRNLKHDCIIKSLGICEGPPLQMIQELVLLGSILQYIETHKDEIDPDVEFKIWAFQIASGKSCYVFGSVFYLTFIFLCYKES